MASLLQKLLLIIQLLFVSLVVATNNSSIILPAGGCSDVCGSVHIPYPFGTKSGCSYDDSFLITCNNSLNPPRPFLPQTHIPIINILLESGELRVDAAGFVSSECSEKQGQQRIAKYNKTVSFKTSNSSTFPLSTRNKFTTLGCRTVGVIAGEKGKPYHTGCVALCEKAEDLNNMSCSGRGCCQMNIPRRVIDYNIVVAHFVTVEVEDKLILEFDPCGYAFVVEEAAYEFMVSDLRSMERKTFPVLLDWAIRTRNLTCEQAERSDAYACKARMSKCLNSTNGPGYRCKCLQGFRGNPYVLDGCQDIDECEENNPCVSVNATCKNLIGNFKCLCLKGFKGDGKINGIGCCPFNDGTNRTSLWIYIALGCFLAIFALLLGVSWIYWGLKKRKLIKLRAKLFLQNGGLQLQQQLANVKGSTETAKIFTAKELKRATNNYEESRVIGQGGYGTVYKGVLTDNSVVAIKKSTIGNQSQIEQFINEIVVLSQINHRNVVKLVGCCLESKVPLLVYEFITNGTLYDHIHDKLGNFLPLSWDMRLQIATETAGAVAYLHSSASMPIIHRDIKTANILLDENCTAKVSDFGASRLVPLDHTEITTLVQGTLGYLDPEYIHTSQLTAKSDVYSFGVVLAELLTGQKALSFNRPECDASLAMFFVTSLKEDRVLEIIDKDLITEENVDQLKAVSNIARSCLRVRGEDRPTMKEVAGELEELRHKGMHPWDEYDSSSSEETDSLLYPYGDKNGDTIGSSTGTTTISTTTGTFDSINVQSLKSSDDDTR